ncbi:exported hypothetical protein [Vibrio chagasii]|nr:exported hypothetical protein [Vibrio chagasii]
MKAKFCLILLCTFMPTLAHSSQTSSEINKVIDCSLYALVVHYYIKDFNSKSNWYALSESWLDEALRLEASDEIYALRSVETLRDLRVINERQLVPKVAEMYRNNNCELESHKQNGDT